jgi:hypothetical protein
MVTDPRNVRGQVHVISHLATENRLYVVRLLVSSITTSGFSAIWYAAFIWRLPTMISLWMQLWSEKGSFSYQTRIVECFTSITTENISHW